ncbi:uncharacterized protein LOC110024486 isoform X3 [Phalaenopsis equestris]|uniref:uncharacterized protein LOC110024486 isoform X3 n=1 Tax=Phalaenopsis equestris TaxID=78828 RepID=UPI0009E2BA2C|nr:uncharacterized protein LOC110024486 isoform X3 [Phalaenopsis equestris]
MDVGKNDARICDGNKTSSVVVSNDGMDKGKEDHGETRSLLLPSLKKGGIKVRRQRSGSKKVQWNDHNGDKLVEVLEFQPRFGSDSKSWINGLHVCCYLQDKKVKNPSITTSTAFCLRLFFEIRILTTA